MYRNVFLLFFVLVCITCISPSSAAWGTFDGRDPRAWDEVSLILARVKDVRALNATPESGDSATHILVLEPLATLAGHFDPSQKPELQTRAAIGVYATSVRQVPQQGSLVLAVIVMSSIAHDENRPFMWVICDDCRFMPDHSALVTVRDMNDKRILEALASVRAARAGRKRLGSEHAPK